MDIEERDEPQEKDFDLTATVDEDDLLPEDAVVADVDDTDAIDVTLKDEDEEEEEVFLYPEGEEPDSL